MAVLTDTCGNCGGTRRVSVGQACVLGRLVWHKAYFCAVCGSEMAEDGDGDLDSPSRDAVLEQEGHWALVVRSSGAQVIPVLKCLRDALGLSISGVAQLKERLPGPIAHGTRAEMEWLRSRVPGQQCLIEVKKTD